MKSKGSKFHPSRVSGKQKFLRELEANKKDAKKNGFTKLDLKKQDWSKK